MVQSRDFIETIEGLFFAAINSEIHFLRYYPAADGDRAREGTTYSKVASTKASFNYLEQNFPEYIFKREDIRLQRCLDSRIKSVLRPARKLQSLRNSDTGLAKKCTQLSDLFHTVPAENKGVTGSILVGLEMPGSDIDFVIYGRKNFDLARSVLRDRQDEFMLDRESWKQYYEKRFQGGGGLGFEEWIWHEKRKFNLGKIDGTLFNLLLVDDEITLATGSRMKKMKVRCKVVDASQAFNVPAVYSVDHELVDSVVSFTHTYAGQARGGEEIEASGVFEKTAGGRGRLVVGTTREAVGEYIRVIRRLDTLNKQS